MTFTLINDGGGKFTIQGNNVVLAAALDYEVATSHTLTVGALGVTPRATPFTFTINVGDTEEPTINLSNTSVLESAPNGTFVGTLSVAFTTGTPSFSLVDNAGGKFAIGGDSVLAIGPLGPLDFETSSSYNITVAVTGVTPLPPNRTFLITVIDVPKAILLSNSSMAENITNGTAIGNLSVWEGTGTYTFTVVSDPDGLFTVDSDDLDKTGVVDYETATSHQVTIRADNGAGDIINQTFTINVTNIVDTTAPVAVSLYPADNATFVDPDTDLVVTLSVDITLGTGNIHLKKTSDNTIVETWDVVAESGSTAGKVEVVDGNRLTLHPTTAMPEEELYVVWDAGAFKSFDHNVAALSSTTAWSFEVEVFDLATLTPGLVFAFRKLVTAYAGNCVRIRASGDSVEANFGFVGDEVDTAGIAAFVTTHGGSPVIVTWYDQSGAGTNITHATPANQPAFIASGINGKPVARFDGVNDRLVSAPILSSVLTNSGETTFMGVMKQNGAVTFNTLFVWPGGFVSNYYQVLATFNNNLYFAFSGQLVVGQPSGWDDVPHIVEGYRTVAGAQEFLVDGDSLVSGTGLVGTLSGGPFAFSLSSNTGEFFGGDIAELVVFKTDIGLSMREVLRGKMSERYGIPL